MLFVPKIQREIPIAGREMGMLVRYRFRGGRSVVGDVAISIAMVLRESMKRREEGVWNIWNHRDQLTTNCKLL